MLVIDIERPGTLVDVDGTILGTFTQVRGNLIVEDAVREVVRETVHFGRQACISPETARIRRE